MVRSRGFFLSPNRKFSYSWKEFFSSYYTQMLLMCSLLKAPLPVSSSSVPAFLSSVNWNCSKEQKQASHLPRWPTLWSVYLSQQIYFLSIKKKKKEKEQKQSSSFSVSFYLPSASLLEKKSERTDKNKEQNLVGSNFYSKLWRIRKRIFNKGWIKSALVWTKQWLTHIPVYL